MGVMLSAAGSLRWFRDSFAGDMSYDALLAHVGDISPGSEGLYFLPYLTGERTPHPDPLARGAFVGLTVRHNLDHMVRAVLEGVAFGLKDSFQLMDEAGLANVEQVRITGGGAKSPVWRQILADILDVELVTVNTSEGAAFGAALLAATGTGAFQDVEKACKATIRVTGSIKPGSARLTYQDKHQLYRELYPALQKSFAAIGLLEQ
jgi:xylulokinase